MAKKVFKYDDLIQHIGEDFTWRRKELHIVKTFIPNDEGPKKNAALRFAVPILYAHWEGFVKKSCELYLEYVSTRYLKLCELKPQFITLALHKKIENTDIKHIESKTKTVEFLLDDIEKKLTIPTKNIIQTKSNLRYDILEEILYIICIDRSLFVHHRELINYLVDSRNNIAHGNYLRVNFDAYIAMHNEIQVVMETLKNEIENCALLGAYKRLKQN